MRTSICPTLVGILIVASASIAVAQGGVTWLNSLDEARSIAQREQRLLLVHFYADWCGPCRKLEQNVFPSPAVNQAIQANYVATKINVDKAPELAQQFQVERIPTDVIIDSRGQMIFRTGSPPDPAQYSWILNSVAADHRSTPFQPTNYRGSAGQNPGYQNPGYQQGGPSQYAQTTSSPYCTVPSAQGGYQREPAESPAFAPREQQNPYVDGRRAYDQQDRSATPNGYWANQNVSPAFNGSAPQRAVSQSPPALDGCCPVSLWEQQDKWTKGDVRWGAIHRGRTYLFASESHQQRFLADPDRYSPVLSGYDPIRYVDTGELVPGHRAHGLWYRDKMFLFASEGALDRFTQSPEYYTQRSHEIMSAR
jgi:protein disulfide-isomerase